MSKLTSCKTCNKEIAKSAKVCPLCGGRQKPRLLSRILVVLGVFLVIALVFGNSGKEKRDADLKQLQDSNSQQVGKQEERAVEQQITDIAPTGELAQMFNLMSPYTDLQREAKLEELKGKTVVWTLEVYEIRKKGDVYEVQTAGDDDVPTFIRITPRDDTDTQLLHKMKTGDSIAVRGQIATVRMRHLVLQPAVLERSAPAKDKVSDAQTPTSVNAAEFVSSSNETEQSAAPSGERSAAEIEAYLLKAAKNTVAAYREGGMFDLISQIQECYENHSNKHYCIYLDVAARGIDQRVGAENPTFPQTAFFADEPFAERVGEILVRSQITLEQANEYLYNVTSTMDALVRTQFEAE